MNETLSIRNADCQLTVTATYQAGEALGLRYEVHNHGPLALYLCNLLHEPAKTAASEPGLRLAPDLVHVQVEPDGVHLDKALMDLSFRDDIRALDIPYLTQVLPGQSYEQALSLPLPLLPYRAHGGRPGQAAPAPLPLWFSLGYFKGEQGITASAQPDTYQLDPAHSYGQQALTAGPFREPIPVANALRSTSPPPVASSENWTPWG